MNTKIEGIIREVRVGGGMQIGDGVEMHLRLCRQNPCTSPGKQCHLSGSAFHQVMCQSLAEESVVRDFCRCAVEISNLHVCSLLYSGRCIKTGKGTVSFQSGRVAFPTVL